MSEPGIWRDAALVVAKHLPPSAATLRLVDVGKRAAITLSELRADLEIIAVPPNADQWAVEAESVDAVVALGSGADYELLARALDALRPGGRLMIIDPHGVPDKNTVMALEAAGFGRILVESAHPARGALLRAEKPHVTDNTLERVAQIAGKDAQLLDVETYRGPYLHLLVRQRPNRPAWARKPDEPVEWDAVAIMTDQGPTLLAFSALPRAVAFMQPAILAGQINDVNKVVKFSRAAARLWKEPVLLNPPVEMLAQGELVFVSIDPSTAEAPDE